MAGTYEKLYLSHIAAPGPEVFEAIGMLSIPNFSVRMSCLTAAALRPQIADLPRRISRANETFERVSSKLLAGAEACGARVVIAPQHPMVRQHKDSIQYQMLGYSWEQMQAYLKDVQARGVPVAVFGPPGAGLARDFRSWKCARVSGFKGRGWTHCCLTPPPSTSQPRSPPGTCTRTARRRRCPPRSASSSSPSTCACPRASPTLSSTR